MKVGDQITHRLQNNASNAPDGIVVVGEVLELTDDTMTVATQFGVRMVLPRSKDDATLIS